MRTGREDHQRKICFDSYGIGSAMYANIGQTTADDWNKEGIGLCGQGKYDEAIKAFEKAIEINPQYVQAWNNRGNALAHQGRDVEAKASLDKAKELRNNKESNVLAGTASSPTTTLTGNRIADAPAQFNAQTIDLAAIAMQQPGIDMAKARADNYSYMVAIQPSTAATPNDLLNAIIALIFIMGMQQMRSVMRVNSR
jgi:tetratricopeptide (TPR) repeat protein